MRLDVTQYEQIVQSPQQVGPVKRDIKLESAADALAFEYKITHNAQGVNVKFSDIFESIIITGPNVRLAINTQSIGIIGRLTPDYLMAGPLHKMNLYTHADVSDMPQGTSTRRWILPVHLMAGTYQISHKVRHTTGIQGLNILSVTYRVVPLNAVAKTLRFVELDAMPTSELSVVIKNANYIAFPVNTTVEELHIGRRVYTQQDLLDLLGLAGRYENVPDEEDTHLALVLAAPATIEIKRQNTTAPIYVISGVVA